MDVRPALRRNAGDGRLHHLLRASVAPGAVPAEGVRGVDAPGGLLGHQGENVAALPSSHRRRRKDTLRRDAELLQRERRPSAS